MNLGVPSQNVHIMKNIQVSPGECLHLESHGHISDDKDIASQDVTSKDISKNIPGGQCITSHGASSPGVPGGQPRAGPPPPVHLAGHPQQGHRPEECPNAIPLEL